MTGKIDFDNPSTWPKDYDIDGLAALADGKEEEPKEEGASEEAKGDDKAIQAKEETKETGQEAADSPEDKDKEEQQQEKDPEGVYAKDGKHILPFEVVADLRRQNRELNEHLAKLQSDAKQMAPSQANLATDQAAQADSDEERDPLEMTDQDLSLTGDALEVRLREIEAEYGRAERSKWKRIFDATVRLNEIEARQQKASEVQQQVAQEQLQEAIDNHPVLLSWQQDSDPTWYQRANDMHQFLMAKDPAYQSAKLEEQMKKLVEKTEAFHGLSPHRERIKAVTPQETEPQSKKEEKAKGLPVPTSMSTIPGGSPPDLGLTETLEKMSPAQMQAYFDKLAANPEKFNEVLAGL
jgi:hypothetical protein